MRPRVLIVGKKSWGKGMDYLLGAAHRVHRQLPDVRFQWIGPGRLPIQRSYLEDATPRPHAAMAEAYQEADLLVHPSLMEASPRAIHEARQAHLPVVATCVGGIPDIPGIHLVPPADPEALAEAIVRWLPS